MKKKNYIWYLWGILLASFGIVALLYWLPEQLLDIPLQKVDILSELRYSQEDSLGNSGKEGEQLARNHTATSEEAEQALQKRDAIYEDLKRLDITLGNRDSLATQSEEKGEESTPKVYFEDFNSSHLGLHNTYTALTQIKTKKTPLRIAFLGDSFIEADIFTLDLRRLLQKHYGGRGAGWMPFSSEVAGYRQGISHSFSGWKDHFIIRQTKELYPLTGHYYTCESGEATLQYKVANGYIPWDCATLFYTAESDVQLTLSDADTTQAFLLPPSSEIKAFPLEGRRAQMRLSFSGVQGAKFYGIALDGAKHSGGVVVDNFSHRGSSGMHLAQLDKQLGRSFAALRPYHLIVLQYGLNVASPKTKDYSYYTRQMGQVIDHLKKLYPHTDFVIMGVSDRAKRTGGEAHTMPAIYALRNAQRKLASEKGIVFWDTFEAMGGEDSMARFVKQGWAAKDYTHLSFKGGKRLAEVFYNSFLFEEKYYQRIGQ